MKGGIASNFRPITCLSILWKLLTGIIGEEIYNHLDTNKVIPDEQKGYCKCSRGTKDQLLIDKMVLKNCKKRLTSLSLGWIDYKKAYDMVPHSWLKKCLEIFEEAENRKKVLEESMEHWDTELTAG